ncbi:MAG: 8-amino-7-oxononanoate synthase [Muribaculaceae bacterium]|nr:8-amino-7-oxononanoate synthase [Muribaculaceae bacterium]
MSYTEQLQRLHAGGNLRNIPDSMPEGVIDLSSNDYLGLGHDITLRQQFLESLQEQQISFTSSASRLLASEQAEYHRLEALISKHIAPHVLLMNSGYHANTGALSALAGEGKTLIVADKLAHASIIDGITLSRAPFERYRHNDVNHLERILRLKANDYDRVIIVTESVFSMDGDTAPINDIIALKKLYGNSLLYVDEAHALGVCGTHGTGICANNADVDVIIGTFGKALASEGAFIAVHNPDLRSYLVNRARSFIFSTAIAPVNCAWTTLMFEEMLTMDNERQHLHKLAEVLSEALHQQLPDNTTGHIQPYITGSAESAIVLSQQLRRNGFNVLPIRTPTVPAGTERLRFSLSAALSTETITALGVVLNAYGI